MTEKTIKIDSKIFEKLKIISMISGKTISEISAISIEKDLDAITNDLSLFFDTYFQKEAAVIDIFKKIITNVKGD